MGNSKEKDEEDDEDDLEDDEDDEAEGPVTTTFELNETLWAEATLEDTDRVYLWLGVSLELYILASSALCADFRG